MEIEERGERERERVREKTVKQTEQEHRSPVYPLQSHQLITVYTTVAGRTISTINFAALAH